MRRKSRVSKKRSKILPSLFFLCLFLLVVYTVFVLFSIFSIKTKDPLKENMVSNKILSGLEEDLEKTVYIFENERDGERRISDIYVFLNNREKNSSLLIYIPGSLYFGGLEEDFGSPIAISSLRYAGDYLQQNRGVEYTVWQLSEILGFKISNYIWFSKEANETLDQVYGDSNELRDMTKEVFLKEENENLSDTFFKLFTLSSSCTYGKTYLNITKVKNLEGNIYSNLSFPSVLKNISNLKNIVKETETYGIDMGSLKYSTEEFIGQGGQIRSININELDRILRVYLAKVVARDLEKERVRIEVYNASNYSGKASVYARKILNHSCDVVRFGTAPKTLEKTQIYVSDKEEFGYTFEIVSEIFDGKFEELTERPPFMTTGDIVIMIGEDISQMDIF